MLYVKTLIPNNVEKDTEITITVKSYNLDANGNVVDLSSTSIVLYAKQIPGIYLSVDDSYNSAYAVRGTNTNVNVKLTGDFSSSNYSVTMSTSSYLINSVLDLVTYNKGDTTTFNSKGDALMTDSIYVGIGVPKGTSILVTAVIETNYNGIIRKITSSLTLTVVDFLIK
jgi:hypothetical protein